MLKSLLCRLNLHHEWRQELTDDGKRYKALRTLRQGQFARGQGRGRARHRRNRLRRHLTPDVSLSGLRQRLRQQPLLAGPPLAVFVEHGPS